MNSTPKHCQYIITKGVRKGLFCITKKCGDDGLCKTHSKSKKEKNIENIIIKENIQENIIIKNKLNILDLPIDILENLIVQNISKGLNIIFNNKIEKIIKYNGSDYYSTFECCGKHCGETKNLKINYTWNMRCSTYEIPFKVQLQCGNCIKNYNKVECGCCRKEFDCKKMNYWCYNNDRKYIEKNFRCNKCIKYQIKVQHNQMKNQLYQHENGIFIQKYNKDINVKSKSLRYKLIDKQIKYKNNY